MAGDHFTIVGEIAVPFIIGSRRAAIRRMVTVSLERMHLGIMVFMGLAAFGLVMIGADSMIPTDKDYRTLARCVHGPVPPERSVRERVGV